MKLEIKNEQEYILLKQSLQHSIEANKNLLQYAKEFREKIIEENVLCMIPGQNLEIQEYKRKIRVQVEILNRLENR